MSQNYWRDWGLPLPSNQKNPIREIVMKAHRTNVEEAMSLLNSCGFVYEQAMLIRQAIMASDNNYIERFKWQYRCLLRAQTPNATEEIIEGNWKKICDAFLQKNLPRPKEYYIFGNRDGSQSMISVNLFKKICKIADEPIESKAQCVCHIDTLMAQGCKCGHLEK